MAVLALVGFYGAIILIAFTVVAGASIVIPRSWAEGSGSIALNGLALVVAGVVLNRALVRAGWSTWPKLGWSAERSTGRDFGYGVGIGVIMGVGAIAVAVGGGGARLELTGEPVTAYLARAVPFGVVLAAAALGEELVFRGYPLVRLARAVGKAGATVVLAVVFAAFHVVNPEVSTVGLLNIGLASLVLSAAFFTPGGLPVAWGVHFGWNGALGIMADAPVSGIRFEMPALEFIAGEPRWIAGGAFGPEGGMATTVVMGVALVWLVRRARAGRVVEGGGAA